MNFDYTRTMRMNCYFCELKGEIKPTSEIEEIAWVTKNPKEKLGAMLTEHIIPELEKQDLL